MARDNNLLNETQKKSEFSKNKESRILFQSTFKRKKVEHFNKVIESQSTSSKKLWKNDSSLQQE